MPFIPRHISPFLSLMETKRWKRNRTKTWCVWSTDLLISYLSICSLNHDTAGVWTLSSLHFVNPGRSALALAWARPPGPAPRCCRPGDSFLCCFTPLLGRFIGTGFLQRHTRRNILMDNSVIIIGHTYIESHQPQVPIGLPKVPLEH